MNTPFDKLSIEESPEFEACEAQAAFEAQFDEDDAHLEALRDEMDFLAA